MATAISAEVRAEVPSALRELVGSFNERNLLTWASALAFQIATSIVPFLLFGFGLIGFLNLDSVWTDIAKNIKPHMSGAAFTVVNDTAKKVVTQKQLWWVTIGFAIAIWQVSGGIRTIMGGLNDIYDIDEGRSWFERIRRSLLIAVIVSALVLAAIAVAWLGPLLYGDVGQPLGALFVLVRWILCASLLALATALTVRLAPDGYQPTEWVSAGTAIVVGAWVLASILFGLYVRFVASYGSIFGNLATIVILFAYIYISAIVFFAGAQVDAIIRRRVEGNPQGR
ncbi:MAG: rane protein [Thermoleophilaceae bacterium]|nr:rane protein [Thermoleophilaceae bacterium]